MNSFQYDYKALIRQRPSRQLDEAIHAIVGVPVRVDWGDDLPSLIASPAPRYSSDINAAFMLLSPFAVWHITKQGDKHLIVDLWKDGKALAYKNGDEIEEPALAICRAYLTWLDRIGR